ncbi:MAG: MtrB/PioB family outer membrane beta-barrel protein, partial [Deltaproteobacteria bacterium]|nr:MtrB/PioB family outer membrane beta-barrel protein [Deltaproteobacteria bacterium]
MTPLHPHTCLVLLLAAAGWLGFAGAARADTQVGPATVSGEAWFGYEGESGDTGSAYWERYRDSGAGANGGMDLLVEGGDGLYLRSWANSLLATDQEYEVQLGQWGRWEVDFGMSQFYQVFSNQSIAAHNGGTDQDLRPDIMRVGSGAAQETQILAFGSRPSLQFRQRDYHARGTWWASEELTLRAGYQLRDRDGERPFAVVFGTGAGGPYANFRTPVDDHTHLWDGSALLVRHGWNAELGYHGSYYNNQVGAVEVANPTDADPARVDARIRREPDNRAHQFSLS